MPKLLLLGDQHLKHDNLAAWDALQLWLTAFIKEQPKLTHVVLMGDMLDRHSHVEQPLMARADKLIMHILSLTPTMELVILVGNHDFAHNQVFLTPDHWLVVYKHGRIPRCTVVDTAVQIPGLTGVLFMPYTPDGRLIEALNSRVPSWKTDVKLLLCHQTFTNLENIGHFLTEADTWEPDMPLAITGHIHQWHWAADNLLCAGSCIPVAHGEKNDKRVWIVDFEVGKGPGVPIAIPVNFLMRNTIEVTGVDALNSTQLPPADQHTRLIVNGTSDEIAAWTKSAQAAQWRAQKNVKVVMRVVNNTPTTVANNRTPTEAATPMVQPVRTFRELLQQSVDAETNPTVKVLWTEFRTQHANMFA